MIWAAAQRRRELRGCFPGDLAVTVVRDACKSGRKEVHRTCRKPYKANKDDAVGVGTVAPRVQPVHLVRKARVDACETICCGAEGWLCVSSGDGDASARKPLLHPSR